MLGWLFWRNKFEMDNSFDTSEQEEQIPSIDQSRMVLTFTSYQSQNLWTYITAWHIVSVALMCFFSPKDWILPIIMLKGLGKLILSFHLLLTFVQISGQYQFLMFSSATKQSINSHSHCFSILFQIWFNSELGRRNLSSFVMCSFQCWKSLNQH
jgi:hypothetical protein